MENNIIISEVVDYELRVYVSEIKKLFNSIGDGVDDVIFNIDHNENEVIVIIEPSNLGYVSIEDWNIAETIIHNLLNVNRLESYSIDTNKRRISLEFDKEIEMGIYN